MLPDDRDALLLLPALAGGGRLRAAEAGWLSRATLRSVDDARDAIDRVLGCLGLSAPADGRAALRLWGQTGTRPQKWLALAEPVTLELRLNDLFVHGPSHTGLSPAEIAQLFEHLAGHLGNESGITLLHEEGSLYIQTTEPLQTHALSAERAGRQSMRSMSEQRSAQDSLMTEVEMLLHSASVNNAREMRGQSPINSLWLSGGGQAPPPSARNLPLLIGDDPQLRGYWLSCGASTKTWSADPATLAEHCSGGFVAVAPPGTDAAALLAQVRELQRRRELRRIDLLFRDGVHVEVRPAHRFRFWRNRRQPLGITGQ